MLRLIAVLSVSALLIACGRAEPQRRVNSTEFQRFTYSGSAQQFISGPLSTACLQAGRKEASRARCSCIQGVADRRLAYSEQLRGAEFFKNPQMAQDTRQSDHYMNEIFWQKWKAYGDEAARVCT